MKKSLSWRAIAAGVLALGLSAMGMAAPASAASPNTIDAAARGSLTITKCETPPATGGGGGDNRMAAAANCTPVEGVGFTVYKVDDIDLTTNDGWADANALSTAFDGTQASITGAGYTVTAVGTEELTDDDGVISLTDLDLGLYFVVETSPLPGSSAVTPFLVTIPTTDPEDQSTWLYDVQVYPKNALTGVTKTVEDSEDVKLGDEIEWTITADIPNVSVVDGYKIVDPLDDRLDYVGTAVNIVDVNGNLVWEDIDPSLYTVVHDAATNTVTVQFTELGLQYLPAWQVHQVQVVITTTVNTIGEIPNTAILYPNLPSFDIEPGKPGGPIETPEVETKWGNATLEKVTRDGAPLAGAVFSVYLTEADALNGTNPISLGGATEFTSDANGLVTFNGLRYSNFADGVTVAPGDPNYQSYWLAEVTAPSGFELLAEPIEFTVTSATTDLGTALDPIEVDFDVVNVPTNGGFELPTTGGTGTTMFWAGGVLLLVGAVFLALYTRNKREVEA